MPLEIIQNDITKILADAIVNAANSTLLGGGGVDGAIHRAAGAQLLEECKTLGGCAVGEAKITKGYNLPARYVIHTVGPIWQGGNHNEERLLRNAYKNSLLLAKEYDLQSIAFPLISAGAYGYPVEKALTVAISSISKFLRSHDMTVYLVIYNRASLSSDSYYEVTGYISDYYAKKEKEQRTDFLEQSLPKVNEAPDTKIGKKDANPPRSLKDAVSALDETFSQMLLRLIDEKGMSDAEAYKKANVDRRLFSKIRSNADYKPSKTTAIAFAIGLKLDLEETENLLMKAGFALSDSNRFDLIIRYYLEKRYYDIFEINRALFTFGENLLGS